MPQQLASSYPSWLKLDQLAKKKIVLKEAFKADPERDGEADVIVAKHRNGPTADIVLAFQGHYSRFSNMARDGGF